MCFKRLTIFNLYFVIKSFEVYTDTFLYEILFFTRNAPPKKPDAEPFKEVCVRKILLNYDR